jgi:hypothetical protein
MSTPISRFELVVKSTLDYLGGQVAARLIASGDPKFAELQTGCLDNIVNIAEEKQSILPAILWEIDALDASPRDPLYTLKFSVGCKTVNDEDNYLSARIASELAEYFQVGRNFRIFDYSGTDLPDASTPSCGGMWLSAVTSNGMRFADSAGLKLLDIEAKVSRAAA